MFVCIVQYNYIITALSPKILSSRADYSLKRRNLLHPQIVRVHITRQRPGPKFIIGHGGTQEPPLFWVGEKRARPRHQSRFVEVCVTSVLVFVSPSSPHLEYRLE